MRYVIKETGKEVDLVLNAPDNPTCPRCGHYNALLAEYQKLRCRNCGLVVLEQEEADTQVVSREMVANASDSAIRDAVGFLREVHGPSFCTAQEAEAMHADINYARETLHNTSYHRDLFAYFAGYQDGGAEGSRGLLQIKRSSN